jgi:hypothetical protein
MINFKIFYSWQSDEIQGGFLHELLSDICQKINEHENTKVVLDRDINGYMGSPDIVRVILQKIEECNLFFADVSFMNPDAKERKLGLSPNPNVFLEMGYALHAKGEAKILMAFNKATGDYKYLPFDIGLKRQLIYDLGQEQDKELAKRQCFDKFYEAIKPVYDDFILQINQGMKINMLPEPELKFVVSKVKIYNNLVRINLSPDQQVWLDAMYEAFMHGEKVKYHLLKKKLIPSISKDFDPDSIDSRLIEKQLNNSPRMPTLTFLGILHANPNTDLVYKADILFRYIKQIIESNPEIEVLMVTHLAEKLNISEREISWIINLVKGFRISSGWGGNSDEYHYIGTVMQIQIGDILTHKAYEEYASIEDVIDKSYSLPY